MKNILFVFTFCGLLFPQVFGNANKRPVMVDVDDYCKLYGAVYVEDVAAFANYKVFVEDIESFADLVVYKENTEAFADQPGYWYFTDVKGFADFTIYLEPVKSFADFSIAYTEFRTAVGCQ